MHVPGKNTRAPPTKKRKVLQECSLNYAPEPESALDPDSLNGCLHRMKCIMREDDTHRNMAELGQLMAASFANRRILINSNAPLLSVRDAYPALFTVEGIIADYSQMVQLRQGTITLPSLRKKLSETAEHLMLLTEGMSSQKTKNGKLLQGKLCMHAYMHA